MAVNNEFLGWIANGNVIHINDYYTTQCCQYNNRIETIEKLYEYFLLEHLYPGLSKEELWKDNPIKFSEKDHYAIHYAFSESY